MNIIYVYFIIGVLTSIFQFGRCYEARINNKHWMTRKLMWETTLWNLIIWPLNLFL